MTDIEITEKDILAFEKKLIENKSEDRVEHFTEFLLDKISEDDKGKRFDCGFPSFNKKMKGLKTGELVTVTGKTGEGKTLLAESWMNSMMVMDQIQDRAKFCIFSYEMPAEDLLTKYVNAPDLPLYLPMQLEVMNFKWLYNRVYEAKLKFGCNIFIFDHLHFLIDMDTRQNMSLNIGAFMRKMKHDIAVALNVCVIMIAHQKGTAKGDEPSLEGIRDSALIAAESDTVIVVWRRKNFSSKELGELSIKNAELASNISGRIADSPQMGDEYSDQFAMIQIAKGRRAGIYRWPKLFQKVGNFLEEV